MNKQPLISIVVPVYNVEKYLSKCLDSLINQTLSNIEIICVNDGTKDNSGEILLEYSNKDARIKVIEQQNTGLSGARNTGMKYVAGKYMMFVDSDDWIDTDTCEIVYNMAEKHNADLILWSYTREFENSSQEKYMFWEDETVFNSLQVKRKLHRRLCGLINDELAHPDYANAIETAWGKLYLSEKLINNNIEFIDTKIIGTEDALFNLYALEYIEKAVYVRKCLNHYRKINTSSLTSTYNKFLFERWMNLFRMMNEYIHKKDLNDDYKKGLSNRIALSLLGLGLNEMSSNKSFFGKCKEISRIVSLPEYREAYKGLNFSYFPIHWKIFYLFAKYRFSIGVYVLLLCIKKIIR